MFRRLISVLLFASFALVSASCRSAADEVEPACIPEFMEIGDCVFDRPCLLVTPDGLGELPEAIRVEAAKYCGKPGVAVVVSSLRPRYLRLLRSQGRLILGTVELNPSVKTAYLCVLSGLGDEADAIRSVSVENADSPDTWNLGVFVKRYPELAARLGEVPSDDPRRERLASEAAKLLSLGSTRTMLERHSTAARTDGRLQEAEEDERRQIGVIEAILSSN